MQRVSHARRLLTHTGTGAEIKFMTRLRFQTMRDRRPSSAFLC
jgi:hypothetical protein